MKRSTPLVVFLFAFLLLLSVAASADTVVTTINLGNTGTQGPPIYNPQNQDVYVSNLGTLNAGSISVISSATNSLVANLGLGQNNEAQAGALDSSTGSIYVPNLGNTVYVISGTSIVKNITVGNGPETPTFDPANGMMYVPAVSGGTVSVIDTSNNSVVAAPQIPGPGQAVYDPTNGMIYVPSYQGLFVISGTTNEVVRSVTIGSGANTPAVDSANGDLYVPTGAGTILVLSANSQVLANVTVGSVRDTPVFDQVNSNVYVPTDRNSVVVISSSNNQVLANVSIGGTPLSPALNPINGMAYFPVSFETSTNLTTISGTAIVGSVPVGSGEGTGIFVPTNGYVYVPNELDGTVSVVGPSAAVTTTTSQSSSSQSSGSGSLAFPDSYLVVLALDAGVLITFTALTLRRRHGR